MDSNVDLTRFGSRTVVLFVVLLTTVSGTGIAAAGATGSTTPVNDAEDGPSVETSWADLLNETAIVAAANLTDLGDATSADLRLEYRENGTDDAWTATETKRANSTDEFVWEISDLDPGTAYEYRSVAETEFGTDVGDAEVYSTPYEDPEVTTEEAINISETGVTLTANVSDLADRSAVDVWFSYNPADGDEYRWWNETETQTIDSPAVVTQSLSGLDPGTEYEFYVSVRDARGNEQYYSGDVERFITESSFAVETRDATAVTESSATLSGEIVEFGDTDEVTTWFEYGPVESDEWIETDPIAPDSAGGVEGELDGLDPGTEYEFRLVGETAGGQTDAGDHRTVATAVDPAVETGDATAVDEESAAVTADLTTLGGADAATVSVEYRAAGADEWTETDAETLTESGPIEATLSGLDADTEYEYRAVVRADDVTDRGAIATVTTDAVDHDPIVTTLTGAEESTPNPHAELHVDWRVTDEDGDLTAVSTTIEDERGQLVATGDESIDGSSASGSIDEKVKQGAGEPYTVTLAVEDEAGNVVTDETTIDA